MFIRNGGWLHRSSRQQIQHIAGDVALSDNGKRGREEERKHHSPTPNQSLTMTEVRAYLSSKVSSRSVLF